MYNGVIVNAIEVTASMLIHFKMIAKRKVSMVS